LKNTDLIQARSL